MGFEFAWFVEELFRNPVLLITVILTLGVVFVNGWTDAPNAIATVVGTRAMEPRAAVMMSAVFNFLGALVMTLLNATVAMTMINMVNFEGTPLYRVMEAVRFEAKRWGVNIIGSEVIGLAPAKALIDCAEYYLQIEDFDYDKQVLENHLLG